MYSRTRTGEPEVPSITTLLGVANARMEWWEALCAVRLAMTHADRLHALLQMAPGKERRDKERTAKDWLCEAAERDRDASAARGDLLHDYAETYALHTIGRATRGDVQEKADAARVGGAGDYLPHFHDFWDTWQPQVIQPEATVWNSTVGYAGTTDLVARIKIRGRWYLCLLDYKTKKALFKEFRGELWRKKVDLKPLTGLQLAAAAHAEEVWIPGDTPELDRWEPFTYDVQLGFGVAIGPDGYLLRQYALRDPAVWRAFMGLRANWDFEVAAADGLIMSPIMERPDQAYTQDIDQDIDQDVDSDIDKDGGGLVAATTGSAPRPDLDSLVQQKAW